MNERYAVITVTAQPGGTFQRSEPTGMDSKAACIRAAEDMQFEFDSDCDPARAYVVDGDGVAVYAAAARRFDRKRRAA